MKTSTSSKNRHLSIFKQIFQTSFKIFYFHSSMESKHKYKFFFNFVQIKASKLCDQVQITVRRGDKSFKSNLLKNIQKVREINEVLVFCTTIPNLNEKKQAKIQIRVFHQDKQMKTSHIIDFSQVAKKYEIKSKQLVYKYLDDVELTIIFNLKAEKHDYKTQNTLQVPVNMQTDIFKSSQFVSSPKSSKSTKNITWQDQKTGNKENNKSIITNKKYFNSSKSVNNLENTKPTTQQQPLVLINRCRNCSKLQKLLSQSKNKEVGLMEKLVVGQIMPSSKHFLDLPESTRQHLITLDKQNQNLKRENIQLRKQLTAITSEKDRIYEQSQMYLQDSISNKQKMMEVVNLVLLNTKADQQLLHIITDVLYKR